jgi:hypothetical protein
MIKKQSIEELARLVDADPDKNCHEFAQGMMFAVRNGDTSCLIGVTQKAGELEVRSEKFMIHIGGSAKRPVEEKLPDSD